MDTVEAREMTFVRAHISRFVAGLGALAAIAPPQAAYRYPHRSEAEALFGDAARIGSDMQRVIDRERAALKAKSK